MYSVVVTSTVGPSQRPPALMPNRLWLLLPSRPMISRLPQPVSSAAWASMNCAGMPVSAEAASAAALCCWTKPAALFSGSLGTASGLLTIGRLLLALPTLGIGPGTSAIWRSSCLAITSDRLPGWPAILLTSWASSISVPSLVAALSSMPLAWVDARMVFISSFMNSDSNCLAASRAAVFGS